MTPELLPVWWAARRPSASRTMTESRRSRARAMAVARPTMPPPMTATSKRREEGGKGVESVWVMGGTWEWYRTRGGSGFGFYPPYRFDTDSLVRRRRDGHDRTERWRLFLSAPARLQTAV